MKTLQEKIAVMQAAAAGETIEVRDHTEWFQCPEPHWDWANYDYRVKPVGPRTIYFIAHKGAPDLSSASFCKPTCDTRDIAAGYNVVEFVEVIK